ncbi:hypothetical protein ACFL5O_09320 [Myxococcota bacterium]
MDPRCIPILWEQDGLWILGQWLTDQSVRRTSAAATGVAVAIAVSAPATAAVAPEAEAEAAVVVAAAAIVVLLGNPFALAPPRAVCS